jgi:hypothetical protein
MGSRVYGRRILYCLKLSLPFSYLFSFNTVRMSSRLDISGKHVGLFYNVKLLLKCIVVPFTCPHIHGCTASKTA